jgi:hypothetical protein
MMEGDMIMRIVVLLLTLLVSASVQGREIAGVEVPETVSQADGTVLQLNGAGIRYKVFFKIYIGELYLANKQSDVALLLNDDGGRRIVMHFLYDEVGKEDLVEAWNHGFQGNGSAEQLAELSFQITTFNTLFDTVNKGDQIILDYMVGKGTTVMIRGEQKGMIEGKPFNDLLLSIWLGKKPVSKDLRDDLLGK